MSDTITIPRSMYAAYEAVVESGENLIASLKGELEKERARATQAEALLAKLEARMNGRRNEWMERFKEYRQHVDEARERWEGDDPIRIQHQIFLDVLREYQHSRWPWVRWVADRMQLDIICRIPTTKAPVKSQERF